MMKYYMKKTKLLKVNFTINYHIKMLEFQILYLQLKKKIKWNKNIYIYLYIYSNIRWTLIKLF